MTLLAVSALLTVTQSPALALIVANDDFADAVQIGTIPFTTTQSTDFATVESGEQTPCDIGSTVWYRYTSPSDGGISLSTAGSDFDTVLAVYTGSQLNDLTLVGCNDDPDFYSRTSALSWQAQAGVDYHIQVGGYEDFGGSGVGETGNLVLRAVSAPANDSLAGAIAIDRIPFSTSQSTEDAFMEPGEPDNCSIGKTVWYRIQTRRDTPLSIDTVGSNFDTVLGVYTGSQIADLALVDCNDDTGMDLTSLVSWTATGGVDYYIQVGGWDSHSGDVVLNVAEAKVVRGRKLSQLRNDDFERAIGINKFPAHISQSNVGATVQPGEPRPCDMSATVWFRYKPRETVPVSLDTRGSNIFNLVAVYTGDQLSRLSQVGYCGGGDGTDESSFPVTWIAEAGVEYHIQLGGWGGYTGDLKLNLTRQ